jgi:hypothetical protein
VVLWSEAGGGGGGGGGDAHRDGRRVDELLGGGEVRHPGEEYLRARVRAMCMSVCYRVRAM